MISAQACLVLKQPAFHLQARKPERKGLPELPGLGLPDLPGDGLPKEPGLGLPELPGDGLPELPGDGLPDLPGDGLPELPGDGLPELPGDGLPELPGEGLTLGLAWVGAVAAREFVGAEASLLAGAFADVVGALAAVVGGVAVEPAGVWAAKPAAGALACDPAQISKLFSMENIVGARLNPDLKQADKACRSYWDL